MNITHSVGIGGVNNRDDVIAVQTALNALCDTLPSMNKLAVDGSLGQTPASSNTVAAIQLFQRDVVGMANPDGRIDVGGRTQQMINLKLSQFEGANSYALPIPHPSVLLSDQDYQQIAAHLGCEVAAIKAVASVESAGNAFFADWRPKMLFEAHIFSRQTNHQYDSQFPQISSPKWDKSLYLGGEREYQRLAAAMTLNPEAALRSASWGRFQIMGFNSQLCGYGTVKQFVKAMFSSEREHLNAFVGFIQRNNIVRYLVAKNWAAFARAYNGPGYANNRYDEKMASAYAKFALHQ